MTPIPSSYPIPTGAEREPLELLPAGVYLVKISKLELKKDQPMYQSTETEDKFGFEFEVIQGTYKGRKLWLDTRTTMSAGWEGGSPSWLYRIFCAVNNVSLGEEEAKSVNATSINEMEGKTLMLVVQQKTNTKGVLKNKITDVLPSAETPMGTPIAEEPQENLEDLNVDDIPF